MWMWMWMSIWIGERSHAGEGELPNIQRLAHHLQQLPLELRQLILEQHAVVGQAYLAGPGDGAAADEVRVGDGVMWRGKGRQSGVRGK